MLINLWEQTFRQGVCMSIAGMVSGGLAALFLLLAAHPFVFYPVSLALLRRIRRRPVRVVSGAGEALSFAVCVAAYNEEAVIEEKVRNLLEMRRAAGELEILVYVDGAGDRTAEILERHAGEI